MKKLFRYALILLLAVIGFKAYQHSQTNGKSFWNNFGKESKVMFDKGKSLVDEHKDTVITKTKEIGSDLKNGFEE